MAALWGGPRGLPAGPRHPARLRPLDAQIGPTPSTEREFDKSIDSLEEIFAFLKEFIDGEGLDSDMAFCIPFVVEEIFTNMVKYNAGSANRIRIAISRDDDRVVVRLTDFDVDPFDPASAPEVDVDLPLEARHPGGLGLHLVKSLADKLTYEYENRVMRISVVKRIKPDVRDPTS